MGRIWSEIFTKFGSSENENVHSLKVSSHFSKWTLTQIYSAFKVLRMIQLNNRLFYQWNLVASLPCLTHFFRWSKHSHTHWQHLHHITMILPSQSNLWQKKHSIRIFCMHHTRHLNCRYKRLSNWNSFTQSSGCKRVVAAADTAHLLKFN